MKEPRNQDLRVRTKKFALRIIRLYATLPKAGEGQVLGKQLLRSGTSVGAHYREAQHAKSDADLINKIEGALQELEESSYWIELIGEAGIVPPERLAELLKETRELIAILVRITLRVKARPKK